MEKSLTIKYQEYANPEQLPHDDLDLLNEAIRAAKGAYAPYSHFYVGAAVRLDDGSIVHGNNQENAAYPSGMCAERTALFAASAQNGANTGFESIAIVGIDHKGLLCEASPCGACRQVMYEYEQRQRHPLRTICYTSSGRVRVFASIRDLLPFGFDF